MSKHPVIDYAALAQAIVAALAAGKLPQAEALKKPLKKPTFGMLRMRSAAAKSERRFKTKAKPSFENSVVSGFAAKGIAIDQILFHKNVLTFNKWQQKGYVPRKGQHGVRGLFHISQCEKLPIKGMPGQVDAVAITIIEPAKTEDKPVYPAYKIDNAALIPPKAAPIILKSFAELMNVVISG